jgi:hypothetical protein
VSLECLEILEDLEYLGQKFLEYLESYLIAPEHLEDLVYLEVLEDLVFLDLLEYPGSYSKHLEYLLHLEDRFH